MHSLSLAPAIVMLLAISGHILLGGTMPDYAPFPALAWLVVPVNLVLVFLIGGPLGEEFGWRGVVLPALEARFRPPWDSLILGIIWTASHCRLFLISASAQHSLPFWLFALLTMPLCILIASGISLLKRQFVTGHVVPCCGQYLVRCLED